MESAIGVVLCAGFGTRLRPATLRCPKPALPFLGKSVASYALDAMARAGIREVGANLYHLPLQMRAALERDCPGGVSLAFAEEPEILGTGGGLRALWARLGPSREVVLYHGDVLCGVDLGAVIAAHRATRALATLVLRVRDPDDALRNVFVDETSQIAGLYADHRHPAPVGRLREFAFAGVHVLSPEVFGLLPKEGFCCLVTDIYTALLRNGRKLGAHITAAYLEDLGTPARFLSAQAAVMGSPGLLQGWIGGGHPRLEPGATLRAPVYCWGEVCVRAGAVVGPNVSLYAEGQGIEVLGGVCLEDAAISGQGVIEGDVRGEVRVL